MVHSPLLGWISHKQYEITTVELIESTTIKINGRKSRSGFGVRGKAFLVGGTSGLWFFLNIKCLLSYLDFFI